MKIDSKTTALVLTNLHNDFLLNGFRPESVLLEKVAVCESHVTKAGVEFAGNFYQVIVRGNQRQNIFHDDQDRKHYLERVEHYRKRYGFSLYAYVLMSNHVHLSLETHSVGLSKIMQGLQFN